MTAPRPASGSANAPTTVLAPTFVATLTLDLEFAIYIGVLLSLRLYLNRTSQPPLEDVKPLPRQHPPAFSAATGLRDCPQLKVVRIHGSIFFGAVSHLQEAMQQIDVNQPMHKHLLLLASGINFVDLAGAQLLAQEARRRRTLGGALDIFHMKDEPLAMLRRCGVFDEIGAESFFKLGDDAIGTLYRQLDANVCAGCTVRIFEPCKAEPLDRRQLER